MRELDNKAVFFPNFWHQDCSCVNAVAFHWQTFLQWVPLCVVTGTYYLMDGLG